MKNLFSIKVLIALLLISTVFACVPARQLQDAKEETERCETQRLKLKKENETLTTENNELKAQIKKSNTEIEALANDTTVKGRSFRLLTSQYDKISDQYEQLLSNQQKLREGANADAQKSMELLSQARTDLQKKEDELRALEVTLNQEKASLEAMKIQNELKEKELADKNAKVAELQALLNAQDSLMNSLRKSISDALAGFEGDGLTVNMKDGNVYVSLDEKLLFKSGRWDVDPKGVQALKNLASVLEKNADINIMIEGHTDELAYGGSGNIQDNWDLSVKRATSIVKILLSNSNIDPKRLTAAGRSSHIPVDTAKTTEARAKNRRTEIILTPNLGILYNIVND
jgi:chemotaxis protein MotB